MNGLRHVVHLRRVLRGRAEPVIDADEDDAVLVEELRLEGDLRFVPLAPFAAMDVDDHRRVLRARRRVDVERLATGPTCPRTARSSVSRCSAT